MFLLIISFTTKNIFQIKMNLKHYLKMMWLKKGCLFGITKNGMQIM